MKFGGHFRTPKGGLTGVHRVFPYGEIAVKIERLKNHIIFFLLRNMEIVPITSDARDEIAEWKKQNKPIIFDRLPFTTLLFGSSGTGKSTAIANALIRNFDGLRKVFKPKHIHIFAKNGESDVNFRALMMTLR
jgi:hypothetical protein